MTLITKGMGAILKKVAKKTKKLRSEIKAGRFPPSPKTNLPFYGMVGTVVPGLIAVEKGKEKREKKKYKKRSTGQTLHKGEK